MVEKEQYEFEQYLYMNNIIITEFTKSSDESEYNIKFFIKDENNSRVLSDDDIYEVTIKINNSKEMIKEFRGKFPELFL